MSTSIWANDVQDVLREARVSGMKTVTIGDETHVIPTPFPSPADWRDRWIYQIIIDRFNNPNGAPRFTWDGAHSAFQGGTFRGIQQRLDYLQSLGVGALWLSPVLKNCQYLDGTYHGYGIQDFLAIEPRFASDPHRARKDPAFVERELRDLVDAAHARGMYVIFDIVLNHAGDVFQYACDGDAVCQETGGAEASGRSQPYTIFWRDANGIGRQDWTTAPTDPQLDRDAAVWPDELRDNALVRRQGRGGEAGGDFASLKELVTSFNRQDHDRGQVYPVHDVLIRAHQYLIAKFDVDGFRIDTLKYIERDFAQIFVSAIREFALSIGKKNFFTFGEVYDNEEQIARFTGRFASESDDLVGADAALDFPLFYKLPGTAKGMIAPSELVGMFEYRKKVERQVVSSHGEASRFFVTFLDNHDQYQRMYYRDPNDPQHYDPQLTLALGCLFTLQGIPCMYYGTEQGLHGAGNSLEAVREALWGKPDGFEELHPFFRSVQALSRLRQELPALRYGRQYFRPISGDGREFGISHFAPGVLAFSRILQDQEVLVVANTNAGNAWSGEVIIDFALNPSGTQFQLRFSNRGNDQTAQPAVAVEKELNDVMIHEMNGAVTRGPTRAIAIQLQPMEIQILSE